MMRTATLGLGLALTLFAANAAADEPPRLLARSAPAGAAAAPVTAAAPAASAAAPIAAPPPVTEGALAGTGSKRAPGTARLSVHAYKETVSARLYAGKGDGSYTFVCQAPCKADVVPGTPLRVTLGDSDEGRDFTMGGNPGTDVDLEVRPASKGALAGGIVMTSLGGVAALTGLLLVAATSHSDLEIADAVRTAGWVCTGLGAALVVGGIVLLANQPHEPRIRERTSEPPQRDHASRAALFAGDVATLRPRSPVAPMHTPFTWGVHF